MAGIIKTAAKAVSAAKPPASTSSQPASSGQQPATSSGQAASGAAGTTPQAPAGIIRGGLSGIGRALANALQQDRLAENRQSEPEARNLHDFVSQRSAATGQAPAATGQSQPAVGLTKGVNSGSGIVRTPAAQSAAGAAAQDPAQATQAPEAAATQAASPVDLSKMTPEQQYDYLRDTAIKNAGGDPSVWKTGENEVNLVGVRSFQDGKAVPAEGDKYNDTVYVCRMHNGKKEVHAFDASTDAGIWNDAKGKGMSLVDRHGNDLGVSHLADGFYRESFKVGDVNGGEQGLQQCGWVRLNADRNNDGVIQDSERLGKHDQGFLAGADWQIQFHRGGTGDTVGETSAGCQAIKGDQYNDFMKLMNEAPNKDKLSYCLTDSSKLEAPGFDVGPQKPWWQLDITQRQTQSNGEGQAAAFLGNVLNPNATGRGVIDENAGGTISDSSQDIKFHHHKHRGHGIIVPPRPNVYRPTYTIPSWYSSSYRPY